MEPTFKIVIINHSFQINYYSRRWQLFAEQHPNVNVVLLAPENYTWYPSKNYSFGFSKKVNVEDFDKGNFRRRVFRFQDHKIIGWTSPDFERILKEENPDVIYHIGMHNTASLAQLLRIRKRCLPKTKVIAFSMRGPAMNLRVWDSSYSTLKKLSYLLYYPYRRWNMKFINRNVDAFFCHYPDAVKCFREEGYSGPIYMQTQVGVNEEWFHEDASARDEIREKYNVGDAFLFGSATRFSSDKGVDLILKALPQEGNWKYFMMGSGTDSELSYLKELIHSRGIDDKVIITGFVDWYDMAKYWNAVDCAIHVPRTTTRWEETFSLAIVQPMVIGKPVIGDDSGSVPYQIGNPEMIVKENDVEGLNAKMHWMMKDEVARERIGKEMKHRAQTSFSVSHLNDLFYRTLVEDVLQGEYDLGKMDMANSN